MSAKSYPLSWPVELARTPSYRRNSSKFGTRATIASKRITLTRVVEMLQRECDLLKADNVVLSTNLQLRLDGLPKANQPAPQDVGVALYFKLKGKAIVMPCDQWDRVECNIMALVKHLEAIRGISRWGVGTTEQHFTGFAALPEKQRREWWDVLNVLRATNVDLIRLAYRASRQRTHPDAGGSHAAFVEVENAWEQACKERPELRL